MFTCKTIKQYFSLLILLLTGSTILQAQNVINTDRPDQSDGTHIVEKNHFQFETGAQFSRFDAFTKGFDNVTLLRYGVTKYFEVRLLNQYSVVQDSGTISGIKPITLSFKNQLCVQKGLLPKLTLVSYIRLPITINPSFPGDHFGFTLNLAGRHDLNSQMKIYSNLGITQDQETTDISYNGSLELNYNVTPNFAVYLEYFGNYATHTDASNGLDIGFIYAIKNNIAIDIAFGSPTIQPSQNRYISFGISTRLPK